MSDLVPQDWQRRSLSSIGEYYNGFAFNESHWTDDGLPIVRIAQITGSRGVIDRYQGQLPDSFRIDDGDLVFSWSGTLAVVRWAGGPAWLNQHLFKVVPAPGIDSSFLLHVLRASVEEMSKRTHGSTMKHIKRGELREFYVSVPLALDEQKQIAHILDTCDAVIQKTEALIDNLKAIKQGVLHDLLTRGIDANGRLRPPQAEAPHLYKESSLGWIPNEWNCGALRAFLSGKPKNGYSPKEAEEWTGVQMLGLGCLSEEGFVPAQLKPAPRGDNRLMAATLQDGDLLMSRANTRDLVGLVGVYRDVGTPCSYPDLMMRLQPAPDTSAEFLQLVLQSPNMRQRVRASAVGTSESMVKISAKIVCELKTVMPPESEQIRILNSLAACDSCLRAEREQGKSLRAMKSALMDDLLTGRVRVTPLLNPTPA